MADATEQSLTSPLPLCTVEAGFEDMRRRVPDIRKIKVTIDWEPKIPLEETLRRIVEAYTC